jgi:hypothetical protein
MFFCEPQHGITSDPSGRSLQHPATKQVVTEREIWQAEAMLVVHFAIERRFVQATFRNPQAEPDWSLLNVVLDRLGWTERQRQELNERCELIRTTDIRPHGRPFGPRIAALPGVSQQAMLLHLDVAAKESRLKQVIRPRTWHIVRLKCTPILRGRPIQQVRLPSWREVARMMHRANHQTLHRAYRLAMPKIAEILCRNA